MNSEKVVIQIKEDTFVRYENENLRNATSFGCGADQGCCMNEGCCNYSCNKEH